jgi:hypothetical protein
MSEHSAKIFFKKIGFERLSSAAEQTLGKDKFAECHPWTLGKIFIFLPPNYFCSPHTLLGAPC